MPKMVATLIGTFQKPQCLFFMPLSGSLPHSIRVGCVTNRI